MLIGVKTVQVKDFAERVLWNRFEENAVRYRLEQQKKLLISTNGYKKNQKTNLTD
jgi:hypothetical protein